MDAAHLTLDRACHAYLYAIREHADERRSDEIDRALEPPNISIGGKPAWWVSDEEAWAEWKQ